MTAHAPLILYRSLACAVALLRGKRCPCKVQRGIAKQHLVLNERESFGRGNDHRLSFGPWTARGITRQLRAQGSSTHAAIPHCHMRGAHRGAVPARGCRNGRRSCRRRDSRLVRAIPPLLGCDRHSLSFRAYLGAITPRRIHTGNRSGSWKQDRGDNKHQRGENNRQEDATIHLRSRFVLRNRIEATRMKRMASEDPANCQPTALECPVSFQGFYCIHRARGVIPARSREQRTYPELVSPNAQHEYAPHRPFTTVNSPPRWSTIRLISLRSSSNDKSYTSLRHRITTSQDTGR